MKRKIILEIYEPLKIKPMNPPSSMIFYLDFVYKKPNIYKSIKLNTY